MLWSLVQQLGTQAIKYGTFVVLAALLAPQDFGLVALATVWLGFQAVFAELGFSAALIQRSTIEPRHLSSTFFLNVAVGALLMVLGIGASWPLAQFYSTPQIQPVIALLSVEFLVDSFSLTQIALAQRTLRFREL